MSGKIIEVDSGEVIAGSVDEAAGVGISEWEGASKFFRYVYFADHEWYESWSGGYHAERGNRIPGDSLALSFCMLS